MTPLTDAQLAAILSTDEVADFDWLLRNIKHLDEAEARRLLDSHTALAARLAEAEWELAADPGEEFNPADNYQREIRDLRAQLAAAEQTIVQRVATIHGLSTIIDAHEAETEDLAQRCDKAVFDLATAQARIERLTTALERFARRNNWDTALNLLKHNGVCLTNEQGSPCYFWDPDDLPWETAEAALAPPAPEADDV